MTGRDGLARRSLIAQLESDLTFGIEEWPRARSHRAAPLAVARAAPEPSAPAAPPAPEAGVVTRVPPLARLLGPAARRRAMAALEADVAACSLCRLHGERTRTVPGEGSVEADLMFIGEGPGADEDRSGRPFVGRAGELLTRIIEAMGFSRETVYIANIVKCRPPGNRDPQPDESSACFPYLERQIDIVAPKVLCTLGLPATRRLLGIEGGIGKVRGRRFTFQDVPLVPTFHPAYLLRNPAEKKTVWQDVQLVARIVQERGGRIPFPEILARSAGQGGA